MATTPSYAAGSLAVTFADGTRAYLKVATSGDGGLDARRPLYPVVTHLARARTFDLWAPDAPEPTDDLAAWVRDELDRRIDAIESDDRTS